MVMMFRGRFRAVKVSHIHPPVPTTAYDYRATLDGLEEDGPYGYGPTAEAALDALEYEAELLDD